MVERPVPCKQTHYTSAYAYPADVPTAGYFLCFFSGVSLLMLPVATWAMANDSLFEVS